MHVDDQHQEGPQNEQQHDQSIAATDDENSDQGKVTSIPRRSHSTPRWMTDYVSREGTSDNELNLVQEIDHEDPIFFEEVVKHKKWRVAMDAEISSIIKKNT
ncbi:hypothetical protein LIER_20934 [Lithospermum erythrorhizon]|uniref:Uncharacterized protein n=1 Tax=Lithospermum erythrorhizon TaxID=34254 RepID=A0AAV3QSE5_LITER